MASDDAEQKLATDDEREEYHIKIELLRNKEKERTELMDNMKRKTYVTVALSLACCAAAAGAIWYLQIDLREAFAPFDNFLTILAVGQAAVVLITLCCCLCIVTAEMCSQFYFAMTVLTFSLFNLMVGIFGMLLFYFNTETPYGESPDNYDDHGTRTIYVAGALAGFVLLGISGYLGMRLLALSQENYYAEKQRKYECCFDWKRCFDEEDDEEEEDEDEEDDTKETEQLIDRHEGSDRITTILDAQQAQRVVNGDDLIYFWELQDLWKLIGSPQSKVAQALFQEKVNQSTRMCIERTHGLPFKNALTGKTTTRYSPILLLQRGYLRNEIWAEHLWATALALALMEIPILEMVDPEQGTGHGAEVLRLFRDMLVNKLDVEVLSAQGEEADTQGATDGADGFDDCDDDLVDPSPSVTDHRYDAISRYSWYQPVIHSIAFMRATLLAAKKEYKMRTTTVADWVNVAREMLYEWSEDEYPKHNDKVHLSFDYGDFDAVLAAVPLLPKEKKEKKMSAQLQK